MIELAIVWLTFAFASALIAQGRGEGGVYFVLGLLLGPLGIVMALSGTGVECPACRSRNHRKATRCSRCGGEELGGMRRP